MTYWWLSFIDPNRPVGDMFIGACIVEAPNFLTAIKNAWERGCNPGGECRGAEFADDIPNPPEEFVGRLLDRDDIKRFDQRMAN